MKKTVLFMLLAVLLLTVSVCSADISWKGMNHQLLLQIEENQQGDKSLYDRAYALYEKKNYYNAHELFIQSQYGDWERMAKKCVRRWPADGEIWHDPSQWLRDTEVTFRVDQPEDTAIFIVVYKNNAPVSKVFIGGPGEVTVMLPGNGKYMIKDGVGSEWYDEDDMFGPDGAYETMTFKPDDSETYYFEQRLSYMITINIEDVIGEDIGSEDLDWKDL